MIFQAVISNRRHPEYGVATIPFPIRKESYAETLVLLAPLEIGDAVKRDCHIEEIRDNFPALKQLEKTGANLDELDQYFKINQGCEFLDAAHKLRLYLKKKLIADSFVEVYPSRTPITDDEFDELVGVRMENTGRVTGVFDIDFDKQEFSAVNIMDGWKTYAMGDVSAAVYHAYRKDHLLPEQRWRRFLDHLDGQEITSAGHLNARSFSFSEEIIANDGKLNFYIDPAFDVDTVFDTHVCTDENDDYLNLYADYDMASGQVCDTLSIILWKGDGQSEELSYTPNAAEKEVLLRKMDEYCRQQTGMTLTDYAAQCMAEQETQLTQPTM